MRTQTQNALNNILDVFSGTDGGVNFVKFRSLLENFDEQAGDGDESAQEVVNIVLHFDSLLKVANE